MDSKKIIKLINKKMKEHDVEIVGCQGALDSLQLNLTKEKKPDMIMLNKLAVLKDKMVFHKACRAQLEDLLNEIQV